MRGSPTTFWGKLRQHRDASNDCEWHPLFDHCADVAAVTEILLGLPLWQQRLSGLAGRALDATDRARLCVFAALHDVGKLNLGFQAKGRADLGPTAGHVEEAVAVLSRSRILARLIDSISTWGDGAEMLLLSAICHHGRPHTIQSTSAKWQASWWRARNGLDPVAGCATLVDHCLRWYPEAFEPHAPVPDTPEFGHAFAGMVMLADWIGSDTHFFPYSESNEDRMLFARARAREAITGLALDIPMAARVDATGRNPFVRVAPKGYSARPGQDAIMALAPDGGGTLTILEAETGSGKTEAALARFVQLFEVGLVDGLYFALPTRSAATQLHERVVAAVQKAFADPPAVVLAVPGYLRVNDVEGKRLPPFEVLWPEDIERFRYRAWAAENPKRFLVGCVVVGTIDQVLLSSLMVAHAHLRASALLRHLLVVDEVHASDSYMQRVLQEVLKRHLAARGHALLLSATLGGEARARLLQPGRQTRGPQLDQAIATPYPLLAHRSSHVETFALPRGDAGRAVQVSAQPWMERAELVAERALAAAEAGAKVLVIRNTVTDCIATQQQLERLAAAGDHVDLLFSCAGVAAPHHARFARPDRVELDRALQRRIGKERPDGGCAVIATQTVQQSLDLDADFLVSDLCPADVLLQRIGRLHRHARERPTACRAPMTLVLVPANRDLTALINERGGARNHHGLGSVYPDLRIIEATWRLVERHREWRIPEMNRLLVERSLHSAVLDEIVQTGGPRWRAHAIEMTGVVRGHARQAELNVVNWSHPYPDSTFPRSSDQRITTRLGEGDRLVHFEPSVIGPFRNKFEELVLPARWVAGLPEELATAKNVSAKEGSVRFELGPHAFVYDRLGLRRRPREIGGRDRPHAV
jgi:CRISPR-associated endonuclease/helicase Cas3